LIFPSQKKKATSHSASLYPFDEGVGIAVKISYQKSAVVIRTTMANLAKYQPNEDLVATGKGT